MSFIKIITLPLIVGWGVLMGSSAQAASPFSAKLLDWDGQQLLCHDHCSPF